MGEWYLAHAGKKTGPLRAKQIARLVDGGAFRASEALVWKKGMDSWLPIPDSGVLVEASLQTDVEPVQVRDTESEPGAIRGAAPMQVSASFEEIVDAPDSVPFSPLESEKSLQLESGIGRRIYITILLLTPLVAWGVLWGVYGITLLGGDFQEVWNHSGAIALLGAVVMIYIAIVISRMRNVGMSTFWILGLLVPFLNLWVSWRIIACPANYADHRKLDKSGKVLTYLFLLIHISIAAYTIVDSWAYLYP